MSKSPISWEQRPILRSSLSRSVYDKMIREQQLRNFDRSKWYAVQQCSIPEPLQEKFVQMHCDNETNSFIELCYEKSEWLFTHILHSLARAILCFFMTSTSINGLLSRGSMFIFSDQQINILYENLLQLKSSKGSLLLDLGAGDGAVTEVLSPYFGHTYVTEVSPVMRRILLKKSYKVLDAHHWHEEEIEYDLISCLNLLDRCDRPLTMLKRIRARLKPNGVLLLALVFPFSQYVESSSNKHKATEFLPITGQTLEEQFVSFYDNVVKPNGFEVIKWTKLPYLCEGDLELSFYWLNDVVIILKPSDNQDCQAFNL